MEEPITPEEVSKMTPEQIAYIINEKNNLIDKLNDKTLALSSEIKSVVSHLYNISQDLKISVIQE